ncbi:MAG: hypothetical protein WAM53_19305 [Terrimicrobiaceae bacterium]
MIKPTHWVKTKFVEVVASITPHCHDITRLLSESMERPLPLWTRVLIRLHFSICVWCKRYGRHLKYLRKFSGEFPEKGCEHGKAALTPSARERLSKAVTQSVDLT